MLGPDSGKQLKAFARFGSLGIELALSVVVGMLGGRWLDGKLSTAPWLMLLGLVLGVIAGFRSLYRSLRKQLHDSRPDHD
ncbi:MAG: AtpZ/AtpI family protein [Polyangiales bacterium]